MEESKGQASTLSDTGSQSDSSFEARQPQALLNGPTEITDALSSRATLEESKNEIKHSSLDAESDFSGLACDSIFMLGQANDTTMDDSKCDSDQLLQVKDK